MRRFAVSVSTIALLHCALGLAQGVGEIVRIPTSVDPRCINAKTDEITVTLRRIITQKTAGFFTQDNRAGVTVLATLNADGMPVSKTPSVNLISIREPKPGQVILPLEYPVASLLQLAADDGKTYTKNMLLDIYMDKTRDRNTFGSVLDTAGSVLAKLPIPANPYSTAASDILKFANDAITKETKDQGGQLLASITLQFNNKDSSAANGCDNFQSTGAIAVVGAKGSGATGAPAPFPLGNLSGDYCWRYEATNTYEVQAAKRPAGGQCSTVPAASFREVPNDYIMLLVSAASVAGATKKPTDIVTMGAGDIPTRLTDLEQSKKMCSELHISPVFCGVR